MGENTFMQIMDLYESIGKLDELGYSEKLAYAVSNFQHGELNEQDFRVLFDFLSKKLWGDEYFPPDRD